jgi:release factor glutamine methyltransferase
MYNKFENDTKQIVENLQIAHVNKIRETKNSYHIKYDKYEITILPNVFPPYIENQLIIDNVTFAKDDCVLDVCAGVGLLSVHAGLNCKKVVATDINPDAIKNIEINARSYNLQNKIQAIEIDTYPKQNNIKFDKILSIPPFSNRKAKFMIERSVWDDQHHVVKKLFSELRNYLAENGRFYLVWSSIGDFATIFDLTKKYKYKIKEVISINDEVSVFTLFEIQL